MKTMLQALTKANKKLTILEVGAGMHFTNKLMNLNGASKVVLQAVCPYNANYQNLDKDTRSVSIEGLNNMMLVKGVTHKTAIEQCPVGISIQAGPGKAAHGYICVNNVYVHFTLPYGTSKATAGKLYTTIVEYCILKWTLKSNPEDCFGSSMIDGVFYYSGTFLKDDMPGNHAPFVMYSTGKWGRLSEALRPTTINVKIVKGSFNPIHDGHKSLMDCCKHMYVSNDFYSMTSKTVEGKSASVANLIARSSKLYEKCIIDSDCITFIDLVKKIELLCGTNTSRQYLFPVGSDVMTKVDVKDFDKRQVRFDVFPRGTDKQPARPNVEVIMHRPNEFSNISSTQIRGDKND